MTAALLVAYVALHAAFTWGRIAVFRIDGPTPLGVRAIEHCAAASIALGATLIAVRPDGHAGLDCLALLLAVASASLFAWGVATVQRKQLTAAFSADMPMSLVTRGPFRYVRNPFYLAYIIAHAIPLFVSRSPWALPGLLTMTAIYVRAVLLEERKFLHSDLAPAWRAYQRSTGRFLPRLRGLQRS